MSDNASNGSPMVSVVFPVYGRRLPADHGYALYAAIARRAPALHRVSWLSVELISGVPWRDGIIVLPINGSRLHLRIPAEHYADILSLLDASLDINGHAIKLGAPTARPLQPTPSLYARIVTIKKFTDAEPFLAAARRQIEALGINASLELPIDEEGRFRRRIIRIHNKAVVGFSLAAHGLIDEDSLALQSHGIGGRRAMGCGIFIPITRTVLMDHGNEDQRANEDGLRVQEQ